jgi:osmotically-inducible protein OsmY
MTGRVSPLHLGARVCFEDRWQGRISGCEVDERWEVVNVTVGSGFLFFRRSVKLPFATVTRWREDGVYFNVVSFHAFAREVPPVAAPARPLDEDTPVSHPGAKFAGLLVAESTRRATAVLVSRGGRTYRVSIADASFEAKTLTLSQQIQNFPVYKSDEELREAIRNMFREDNVMPTDEKQALVVDVNDGVLTLAGNVRMPRTAELAVRIARRANGVVEVGNEIVNDIALETAIGLELDRSGVQRKADVYARASLGEVLLYGYATSPARVDDIVRTAAQVPGVRKVTSRLEIQHRGRAAGPSLISA